MAVGRLLGMAGRLLAGAVGFIGWTAASSSGIEVDQNVLIKTPGGATLSAIVVRDQGVVERRPTLFTLDIYTDPPRMIEDCKAAVARGYICVMADTRGKRLSPDAIVPYEHDSEDSQAVLDWIIRQSWSDGQVGMRGGSYSGFTAWAAAKHKHPALKTIAVSAAAIPGLGLPMHNNVFLNANYGWAFFTTHSKFLDHQTYNNRQRWFELERKWFASGRSYREIDKIDGTPNPWLQRWLQHPAYDGYWQRMVPYGEDYAGLDIPVLTITGYYDDGQVSALHYLKEHYRERPNAEHYAVIGPYDHFGAQSPHKEPVLRNYPIDPVAQFDTPDLVLDWMDHVLRDHPRPALLRDRINFQVMGANEWRHAGTLDSMSQRRLRLYLSDIRSGERLQLTSTRPDRGGTVVHTVDLANRNIFNNYNFYPFPIQGAKFQHVTELQFISEPFANATILAGAVTGTLSVAVSKKDFDFGITAFEMMPDGTLFNLGYSLERASFTKDRTRRQLLQPGQLTQLPFATTVVARRLAAGSRLLLLFDVHKNPGAQVNYGTGKDVSDESIADAGEPLQVTIFDTSFVDVPIGG